MKYFFILGNHPELSIAEIKSLFIKQKINIQSVLETDQVFIFETEAEIKPDIINYLGGSIKFGEIFNFAIDSKDLLNKTLKHLPEDKKIYFGLSYYNKTKFNSKNFGFQIKEKLETQDRACRFVTSKENPLSSVIVKKNKLISPRGFELNLVFDEENIYLGKTLTVQDFQKYSKIDYGRPDRDDISGMLPPKLAQIMVNLSEKNNSATLIDPFCGSGTVLQMAALNGFTQIYGSDLSEKAFTDTKNNLDWLQNKFSLDFESDIQLAAVKNLKNTFPNTKFDAIVTEPLMGPPLHGNESPEKIKKNIQELTELYKNAFNQFNGVCNDNCTIIFIFPEFVIRDKHYKFDIEKIIGKQFEIIDNWQYSRPNQKVIRNIYKLIRK